MDLLAQVFAFLAVVTPAVWGQLEVPAFIVSHSGDVTRETFPHTRVSLACAAFGIPTPNMSWSSSTPLSDVSPVNVMDSSISIYTTNFTDADGDTFILSVLELCDFGDSYAANYTCTATNRVGGNSVGPASVTVSISAVAEPAILVAQSSSTTEVFPGTRVSLICAAFGLPIPNIMWSKDITPLMTDGNVNIYTEQFSVESDQFMLSILELCTSGSNDTGEYTCTASNGVQNGSVVGSASATFELIAEYPVLISSLRLIAVEPTPTSLELSCTPDTTAASNYDVSVEWTQEFANGSLILVEDSISFQLTPPETHQMLKILEYDFSDTLSFRCTVVDLTGNSVATVANTIPLKLVTSELSVYMDGIQLGNQAVIEDGASEQLTLQCLATPGNYDPIWIVIPTPSSIPQPISDSFDFVVSYSSNEANLTIVDYGSHTGSTLRCQSQQSNATVEVIIAVLLELDTSKQQATILGAVLGVTGGILLIYTVIMVLCCVIPRCPLREVFSGHPVPPGIDDGISLRQLQSAAEEEEAEELRQGGVSGGERREIEKMDIHVDDELLLP